MTTSLHKFTQKTYEFLEPQTNQVVWDNLDADLTRDDDEYVLHLPEFLTNRGM